MRGRKRLLTAATLALFAPALVPAAAQARNIELESSLRSLSDTSDFYNALVTTGVANELHDGEAYTVMAPTNAAFAALNRQNYPCFYQAQCRDLAAAFVRAHILEGRYPLQLLARSPRVETEGRQWVKVEEPFVNQYSVNGGTVLSEADAGNTIIYRLDAFVVPQKNLAVFQTASYEPAPSDTLVTRTTTTYVMPVEDTEVDVQPVILPGINANATTVEKTTVTRITPQPVTDPVANSW
jgi:uncharacterized surface protein with fasciclin (FAS1) repeats